MVITSTMAYNYICHKLARVSFWPVFFVCRQSN